jgi:TPR repeat protein
LFGSNRNPDLAVLLYRKAAEKGYAGSQNNLGDQYESGNNLPKSDEFAVYWYARSAERGEPTAYLSLATLFSQKAVDKEMLIEAAKFAILAIERLPDGLNKKTAKECLASLSSRLEEDDLELAYTLAEGWSPLFQEHRLMSDTPQIREYAEAEYRSLH